MISQPGLANNPPTMNDAARKNKRNPQRPNGPTVIAAASAQAPATIRRPRPKSMGLGGFTCLIVQQRYAGLELGQCSFEFVNSSFRHVHCPTQPSRFRAKKRHPRQKEETATKEWPAVGRRVLLRFPSSVGRAQGNGGCNLSHRNIHIPTRKPRLTRPASRDSSSYSEVAFRVGNKVLWGSQKASRSRCA